MSSVFIAGCISLNKVQGGIRLHDTIARSGMTLLSIQPSGFQAQ